jgi:hypothetical protein
MREFGIVCNFIPHGAGYTGTTRPGFPNTGRFIAKPTQHGVFIVVV